MINVFSAAKAYRSTLNKLGFVLITSLVLTFAAALLMRLFTYDTYWFGWVKNDIAVYLPMIVLLLLMFQRDTWDRTTFADSDLRRFRPGVLEMALLFFAMYLMTYAGSFVTTLILDGFGLGMVDVFQTELPATVSESVVFFIAVGIVAPAAEEFIYRKLILGSLKRFGAWKAVIVSSLLFAVGHGNYFQFLYAFLAGIVLGTLAVRTGGIRYTVVLHIINNIVESARAFIPSENAQSLITLIFLALGIASVIVLLINQKFSLRQYRATLGSSAVFILQSPVFVTGLLVTLAYGVYATSLYL